MIRNFVDSAVEGYRFLIGNHRAIYNMALAPFLVKLACFIVVTALDLDGAYLRHGLILLPSYFVEGWLIAKLIRFAVLGEISLPDRPAALQERSVSLKASMLIYVLIKVALAGFGGWILENQDKIGQGDQTLDTLVMAVSFGGLLVMSWGFRLLWIYVPVALGQSPRAFLKKFSDFKVTLYMMGTWTLCFIPMILALLFLAEITASAFGVEAKDNAPMMYTYLMLIFQAGFDVSIAIVGSVAMAYLLFTKDK